MRRGQPRSTRTDTLFPSTTLIRSPVFERELNERGLQPDQRSSLLAMLLVDASIELADGLTREGVRPKDADDLIAAAALDVRPEYVRDLKSEALVLTDVGDAIACKALGVDGAYVRGLAAAGYRQLSADEIGRASCRERVCQTV